MLFFLIGLDVSAQALDVTKIKLSTMSVGPIELFSDNGGRAKLISHFGTVVITREHHSQAGWCHYERLAAGKIQAHTFGSAHPSIDKGFEPVQ